MASTARTAALSSALKGSWMGPNKGLAHVRPVLSGKTATHPALRSCGMADRSTPHPSNTE
eukprot:3175483-Lingulodinium_polyedra.AAC.1